VPDDHELDLPEERRLEAETVHQIDCCDGYCWSVLVVQSLQLGHRDYRHQTQPRELSIQRHDRQCQDRTAKHCLEKQGHRKHRLAVGLRGEKRFLLAADLQSHGQRHACAQS
jgi:hypothetical protein